MGIPFGCGLPSYMIKDCQNTKKTNEKWKFKVKKENKKAMIVI